MCAQRNSQPPLIAPEEPRFTETRDGIDEKRDVQEFLAQVRKTIAPLQALLAVKPGAADALDRLEQLISKLPSGKSFDAALGELRTKGLDLVSTTKKRRASSFGRSERDFIKAVKAAGETTREQAEGWRIGRLELQLKRESLQARTLYNREQVMPWTKVSGSKDLEQLMQRSNQMLDKLSVPDSVLQEAFDEAYSTCVRAHKGAKSERVALKELYQEVRVALVRNELRRRPEARLSHAEFPLWAFLFNLDRYTRLGVPNGLRLETGSQQETARLGLVVNGLDAQRDYSKACFVVRT